MIVQVFNGDLQDAIRAWKKKLRADGVNDAVKFREKWPSPGERERAKRHRAWKRGKKNRRFRIY